MSDAPKSQPAPAETWEVVTIPGIAPDHALAVRAVGVDGFVEVKTRTNFADLKVDADKIALALNGYGFTREDVGIIREGAKRILSEKNLYVSENFFENLNDIADRIEALLPPLDADPAKEGASG